MQINISEPVTEASLPWYHYGMVWMVIALPLIVVVASMVTISIAFNNSPEIIPSKQQQKSEVKSIESETSSGHELDVAE